MEWGGGEQCYGLQSTIGVTFGICFGKRRGSPRGGTDNSLQHYMMKIPLYQVLRGNKEDLPLHDKVTLYRAVGS